MHESKLTSIGKTKDFTINDEPSKLQMEHSFQIITKHCAKTNVQPMELLGWLIEMLRNKHHLSAAASGFAGSAVNKSTVYEEISGNMHLLNKTETPTSLLAALEGAMEIYWLLDNQNSKNPNAQPKDRENLAHRAKVLETLRNIIRDAINQTETVALQNRIDLEKRLKKKDDDSPK